MTDQEETLCPSCGSRGRKVRPITIESLLTNEARRKLRNSEGFRFCAERDCDVAYYDRETGERFLKHEVRVRIGKKESTSPRPICYCFAYTVEEIEAEVEATGTSVIQADVTEKCRQGLDRCEETNPQGSCCLGDIQGAIRAAMQPGKAGL